MHRLTPSLNLLPSFATISTILTALLHPPTSSASCECGYRIPSSSNSTIPVIFTHALETDFTILSSLTSLISGGDWSPQSYIVPIPASNGPFGKNASLANIVPRAAGSAPTKDGDGGDGDGGLDLWVRGSGERGGGGKIRKGGLVGMAEIASVRDDILYGTFRAGIQFSDVGGTCGAFFWYRSDTAELDIEYLSHQANSSSTNPDNKTYPLNVVLQSPLHNPTTSPLPSLYNLTFQPSAAVHEYRIDWLPALPSSSSSPAQVAYLVDGNKISSFTAGVPTDGGHLALSHWSNGNPGWSGGPPEKDARMMVKWVRAYFNSSDVGRVTAWEAGCKEGKEREVCDVLDAPTGNEGRAGEVPRLLNGNGKGTASTEGEGEEEGRTSSAVRFRDAGGWRVLAFAAVVVLMLAT